MAISQRSGLGQLRHIQTQCLWLQERVSAKELKLTKAVGTANPADMLTKNLARADLDRHLELSSIIICTGRADGSLHVNPLERRGTPTSADCSFVGARIAAALCSASRSFMMMGTSNVGLPPSSVGGYYF